MFTENYLNEVREISIKIDSKKIERIALQLSLLRKRGGRLFFLGVGGSAANCSHAVNDFRKLAKLECYSPVDNVAELTARTNDEGWDTAFAAWLTGSNISQKDAVFVFSVGGGDREKNISVNIVNALDKAKSVGATILGIVGRENGHTYNVADECVVVPAVNLKMITPHSESFQSIIWHLLVSHPLVKLNENKW